MGLQVYYDQVWFEQLRHHVRDLNLDGVNRMCIEADGRQGKDGPAIAAARLLASTGRLAVALVKVEDDADVAGDLPSCVDAASHAAELLGHLRTAKPEVLGAPDRRELNRYLRPYKDRAEAAVVKLCTLWWLNVAEGMDLATSIVDSEEGAAAARFAFRVGNNAGIGEVTVGRLPFPSTVAVQHPDCMLDSPPDQGFTQAMDEAVPGHWWRVDRPGELTGRSCQGVAAALAECLAQGWTPRQDVLVMAQLGPDRRLRPVDSESLKAEAADQAGIKTLVVPPDSKFKRGGKPVGVRTKVVKSVGGGAALLAGRMRFWRRALLVAGALAAVLLTSAAILGPFRDGTPAPESAVPFVASIIDLQPADGSLVTQQQAIIGEATGLGTDDELFLIVVPESFARFYPQGGAVARGNGPWAGTATFGQTADSGERFRLLIVLADQDDRERLATYLRTGETGGLAGLSPGTKVVEEVDYHVAAGLAHVEIRSPAQGELVPIEMPASGVATGIPSGQRIWLMVLVDGGYYPQLAALDVSPDGAWSQTVRFGGSRDSGKAFTLLAVQSDSVAHARFTAWIDEGRRTGNYPALREGVDYPQVTTVAAVPVIHQ